MAKGTTDFELRFFEGILNDKPDHLDAMLALAEIYTRKGMYEKGLALDQRLAGIKADDETVHYNLACSYALVGKTAQAIDALKKAVKLGYSDFEHMRRDSDLESLREDAWFRKTSGLQ